MIAHLAEDLQIGGQERIIELVVVAMHRLGLPVKVFGLSRGGKVAEIIREQGVPVEILSLASYHSPGTLFQLFQVLRRQNVSIVHTHGIPAGILGRTAARLAGIPAVHHYHSLNDELLPRHKVKEWLVSMITPRILCGSRAVVKSTLRLGISPHRLRLLYNAVPEVPPMDVGHLRSQLNIPETATVFGNIASLSHFKGQHLMIEAMRELPDCHLVLVGGGRNQNPLEAMTREWGLTDRVHILGRQPETTSWHRFFDVYVMPSLREGLPMSLLESMSCAKPVIVSNAGGMPEAVRHGQNGWVVPMNDVPALVRHARLLAGKPDLQSSMGQCSRRIYDERFTIRHMVQGIIQIYRELSPLARNVGNPEHPRPVG